MLETIIDAVQVVALAIALAGLAGLVWGITQYVRSVTLHLLNKRKAVQFLILSGDQAAVREMYEVCLRVANNIVARQQQEANGEGIQLKDDSEKEA